MTAVTSDQKISFGPFRLDALDQCLWREGQAVRLAPKEFAVLLYLVRHPGRLITKEELIEAVWPDTMVADGVLKVSIRKIRAALDDDPKSPSFIETAHRRGYRFIGPINQDTVGQDTVGQVAAGQDTVGHRGTERTAHSSKSTGRITEETESSSYRRSGITGPLSSPSPLRLTVASAADLVGRAPALAQMRSLLERVRRGERQVVFVTGEAGIGKTTLVEAFLRQCAGDPRVWIARGQCLEQYGAGEAYLPVLEAVSRLCQEPGRTRLVELLRRQAPTWLQQLPWLVEDHDRENLQRAVIGATRERMLREMAEALEALTAATPLILVLEDLHWSDYSTLDLVSYLARRSKPAQLMVLVTYRPVDVAVRDHPLKGVKQELLAHRQCEEIPLEYLAPEGVSDYLAARYPGHELPAALATLLHQRTDGNPFFLVNAVDYLQAEGVIAQNGEPPHLTVDLADLEVGVPESIRQMIEKQIERLNRNEQRVLEAAAVAGLEFAAAAVAAGMDHSLTLIEEQCEELDRRQLFLRSSGVSTFPDGTVTARYTFIHALYQEVIYSRIAAGRRARFHLAIGERGEYLYGDHAGEVAGELAMHFEQGLAYRRAVKYLRLAAKNHFLRYANREALAYLRHALELVERWPEEERAEAHMAVLEQAGLARRAMGDMDGAAADFQALAEYAAERGRREDEVRALVHLATALSWVDRQGCLDAAERFLALSESVTDELLQAHVRGCWGYWHVLLLSWGDEHRTALSEAVAAARRAGDREMLGLHLARDSFFECLRSEYATAIDIAEEAAHVALELSDAHSYLLSQYNAAWALLHLGRWGQMRRILDHGLEMAERNEHRRWEVLFRLELGWLLIEVLDFESARRICERSHEQAQRIQHPYTESLALILRGLAHLGLEQHVAAFACFTEVSEHFERQRTLMDWVLRILLHQGMSRYWLACGEYAKSRAEAARVCELAGPPGERTYLALAHLGMADVEMAVRDWEAAAAAISQSLAFLEKVDAPLAEWRVRAAAARIDEQLGRTAEAAEHRRRGLEIVTRLADSLEQTDRLRDSLLASPAVQDLRREKGRVQLR